jgi:CMP/dCMP kinase
MNKKIAIAIDGPAAAGKSTVAKIVASKLSYIYIDTGAMYRAITLKALENSVDVHDENSLEVLLKSTDIKLIQQEDGQRVLLDGRDVTTEIRSKEVTNNVSYVSQHPKVRVDMVNRQQKLAELRGVVMDGRDIGTKVIPDAEVKIFLVASVEERAKRRHTENLNKGFPSDLEELKKDIEKRDLIDSQRDASPLVKAEDAIEIDTTSLTIEEVAEGILMEVNKFNL